jgi:hypothetical protein
MNAIDIFAPRAAHYPMSITICFRSDHAPISLTAFRVHMHRVLDVSCHQDRYNCEALLFYE